MTLKSDTKFGEESNRRFKMDMTNLTNFGLSIRKSQTGPSIKDILTLGGGGGGGQAEVDKCGQGEGGMISQMWTSARKKIIATIFVKFTYIIWQYVCI